MLEMVAAAWRNPFERAVPPARVRSTSGPAALPRRRPDVRANFIVKDNQARRVALVLDREIEQRRRVKRA